MKVMEADNLVGLERDVRDITPSVHTSGVPLSKIHCNVDRLTPPQSSLTITTNLQLQGWAVIQLSPIFLVSLPCLTLIRGNK